MPILALMGLIQFGIPLILFARGALSVPAVTLSLIALLDVGLNPLWAWIGSVETPAIETAIGAGMIGAAVALSILGGQWMTRRIAERTDRPRNSKHLVVEGRPGDKPENSPLLRRKLPSLSQVLSRNPD